MVKEIKGYVAGWAIIIPDRSRKPLRKAIIQKGIERENLSQALTDVGGSPGVDSGIFNALIDLIVDHNIISKEL